MQTSNESNNKAKNVEDERPIPGETSHRNTVSDSAAGGSGDNAADNSAADNKEIVDEDAVTQEATPQGQDARHFLSRRRFLTSVAASATALVAIACGRERPTPTPTPAPSSVLPTPTGTPVAQSSLLRRPSQFQVFLPSVEQNIGPRVALVPEPTFTPTPPKPTSTPAPPTPTPLPTPTPTPVATPFPPGPPSKLGLFVARNDPQIFDLVATGAVTVVKTLELDATFVGDIKRLSPNTKIIGRLDLPQVHLGTLEPQSAARTFVEELLPWADDPARRPHFDGWEAYNEPVAGNADEMRRLADFEAERTRLLAERGIRSVIGNFGTGQPPLEMWEFFFPALHAAKETGGWLGLHEYSAPTIYHLTTRDNQGRYPGVNPSDTGWLTLRYRQVYDQILIPNALSLPLAFTELGVDGLVADRPGPADARGWQDFQQYWAENGYGLWGPGAYIEQLVWFDAAMRQNDYVLGGCVYAMAASSGWESYDILGPAGTILEQYLSVHAPA